LEERLKTDGDNGRSPSDTFEHLMTKIGRRKRGSVCAVIVWICRGRVMKDCRRIVAVCRVFLRCCAGCSYGITRIKRDLYLVTQSTLRTEAPGNSKKITDRRP
jgi:hypothetical protein